jgi:hypothetical protein
MNRYRVLFVAALAAFIGLCTQIESNLEGRDLTSMESSGIFGGQAPGGGPTIPGADCEFNPACNLVYFTNSCTDSARNSADLCKFQSLPTGNSFQCVTSSLYPDSICENSTQVSECVVNYPCQWDEDNQKCIPSALGGQDGGDNVTNCTATG